MGRLPKKYSYILWMVVAIRLLCPVGIPSSFSVFNLVGEHKVSLTGFQGEAAAEKDAGRQNAQNGNHSSAFSVGKDEEEPGVSEKSDDGEIYAAGHQGDIEGQNQIGDVTAERGKSNGEVREAASFVKYGAVVWIAIGAFLVAWNFLLMVLMRRRVSRAVRLRDNIYECDSIPSPFVMGFARAKIYIPFRLKEEEQVYIIRHEQYHVVRRDNVVKLIAFLIACVYWFHPLVWLSYFLMIRDMEMSCDEYVLQKSAHDIREDYSRSLLGFAVNQRNMGAGLIAFGESDARRRVKHIMKFKKCGKWIGMIAIGVVLVVGVACLTDARGGDADSADPAAESSSENNGSVNNDSRGNGTQNREKAEEDSEKAAGKEEKYEETFAKAIQIDGKKEKVQVLQNSEDVTDMKIMVGDSEAEMERISIGAGYSMAQVKTHDYTGDGREEIILKLRGGASGTYQEIQVLTRDNGQWRELPFPAELWEDDFVSFEKGEKKVKVMAAAAKAEEMVAGAADQEWGVRYRQCKISKTHEISVVYEIYCGDDINNVIGQVKQTMRYDKKSMAFRYVETKISFGK